MSNLNQGGGVEDFDQSESALLLKKATELSFSSIDDAISLIRSVLKKDPTQFQAHRKLASYLQLANRFDEAKQHLLDVLETCSLFEKELILDQLAVIHKKQKR